MQFLISLRLPVSLINGSWYPRRDHRPAPLSTSAVHAPFKQWSHHELCFNSYLPSPHPTRHCIPRRRCFDAPKRTKSLKVVQFGFAMVTIIITGSMHLLLSTGAVMPPHHILVMLVMMTIYCHRPSFQMQSAKKAPKKLKRKRENRFVNIFSTI